MTQGQSHEGLWWVTQGLCGAAVVHPGGLRTPSWETDRYAIQREFGYRVYLVGYEGKREGEEGEGGGRRETEREREGGSSYLFRSGTGRNGKKEQAGKLEGDPRRKRSGVGRVCLLKGQSTQVTDRSGQQIITVCL